MKGFIKNTDGNFSIIMAFGLSTISLAMATGLDISRIHSAKISAQDSLDLATFYAASHVESESYKEDSKAYFHNNFNEDSSYDVQSLNFAPNGDAMVGTTSVEASLVFGGLIGRKTVDINVRSVVNTSASNNSAPCIMALSTTKRPGILLNSGASIEATGCNLEVASTANPAFTINNRAYVDAPKICVAGDKVTNNTGAAVYNLETNCAVAKDPYKGVYPVPDSISCDFNNGNYSSKTEAMTPGVYCGYHNFNNAKSQVSFAPGLYVIKGGGWNVNGGTWSGKGVTFYYADSSKIQFNSGVKASFTAPTSGDYKNVFMTEDPNLPVQGSQFILNANDGFDFEGAVYLPSRDVIFNSGSNLRLYKANLIANSFVFNQVNLKLEPATTVSGETQSTTAYLGN